MVLENEKNFYRIVAILLITIFLPQNSESQEHGLHRQYLSKENAINAGKDLPVQCATIIDLPEDIGLSQSFCFRLGVFMNEKTVITTKKSKECANWKTFVFLSHSKIPNMKELTFLKEYIIKHGQPCAYANFVNAFKNEFKYKYSEAKDIPMGLSIISPYDEQKNRNFDTCYNNAFYEKAISKITYKINNPEVLEATRYKIQTEDACYVENMITGQPDMAILELDKPIKINSNKRKVEVGSDIINPNDSNYICKYIEKMELNYVGPRPLVIKKDVYTNIKLKITEKNMLMHAFIIENPINTLQTECNNKFYSISGEHPGLDSSLIVSKDVNGSYKVLGVCSALPWSSFDDALEDINGLIKFLEKKKSQKEVLQNIIATEPDSKFKEQLTKINSVKLDEYLKKLKELKQSVANIYNYFFHAIDSETVNKIKHIKYWKEYLKLADDEFNSLVKKNDSVTISDIDNIKSQITKWKDYLSDQLIKELDVSNMDLS